LFNIDRGGLAFIRFGFVSVIVAMKLLCEANLSEMDKVSLVKSVTVLTLGTQS
jgi:hypothetical protein